VSQIIKISQLWLKLDDKTDAPFLLGHAVYSSKILQYYMYVFYDVRHEVPGLHSLTGILGLGCVFVALLL